MMTADKLAPLLYRAWNPNGAPWESLTAATRAGWRAVAAESIKLLRKEDKVALTIPVTDGQPHQGYELKRGERIDPNDQTFSRAPVPGCAMRGKGCVMNEITPCPTCGCVMVKAPDGIKLLCTNCQYTSLPDPK